MIKLLLPAFLIVFISSAIGQINFQDISFDEAILKAKAQNKKVFIDVYTVWCGPCKRIDADVFQQKEIGDRMNPDYVSIKIEAEKDDDRVSLQAFSIKGYPTMLILDGDGKLLHQIVGSKSIQGFHRELNMLLPPEQLPHNLAIKAMKDNPKDETIWRKSLKTLLVENKPFVFDEYARMYVDQFDFLALNDKLDSSIFSAVTLPLDHPIVKKILKEKRTSRTWWREKYKKLEFTDLARNAASEEIYLAVKANAKVYYDKLHNYYNGDLEEEEYFMEEVFPKDLKPAYLENGDEEIVLKCSDRKTERKRRRAAKRM